MIPLDIRLTKNKSINLWLAAVWEKGPHALMRESRVVTMVVESNLKISINITYTHGWNGIPYWNGNKMTPIDRGQNRWYVAK